MSTVMVTGAAGFIGSHVVDRLLADGREVVGVDAFTDYYSRSRKERNLGPALVRDGFRLVEGDLLRLDVDELLGGVEGVLHLAGEPGVRRSWGGALPRYVERNLLTTERLLEAAWRNCTPSFVYASSSSVYGSDPGYAVEEDHPKRPTSPYGLSKLAAEDLVGLYARERDVPGTVLRYFTVYGPRQRPEMAVTRFIRTALRGRPFEVYGDGEQARDMTYVSDAVEATVASLDAPAGIYNVGGGTRTTVNALLDTVRAVTGSQVGARHLPAAEGDVRSTWADSTLAARYLGYESRVGLEEGVAAQVEWARQNPIAAPA